MSVMEEEGEKDDTSDGCEKWEGWEMWEIAERCANGYRAEKNEKAEYPSGGRGRSCGIYMRWPVIMGGTGRRAVAVQLAC